MKTAFSQLSTLARTTEGARIAGEVSAIVGLTLTVVGLNRALGIGQRCTIKGKKGPVLAEVVSVDEKGTQVLPFGNWNGVTIGDRVEISTSGESIRPDLSWIGRVLNALGDPIDGLGSLHEGPVPCPPKNTPPNAYARRRVGERIDTGVRVFDVFTPLCKGQRMGIFAGSGVGKSSLLSMMARRAEADVIVVGLVGERGREVQDFIQKDLGAEGLNRSVIVVSTGDEPPLMRRQAAWTATAVAEYFRDQGLQVLLLIDSVTRFAMAQREIGLAGGEPPTTKGYPPTVFSELPQLLERSGPGVGEKGDITALYTVLVDGDDMNEPVSDAARGIMDGHVVLDRAIAEQGRFPAVNIQKSVSRMLPDCHNPGEYAVLKAARRALARYADMEELIRIGAYREGSDEEIDAAVRFARPAENFLTQSKTESTTSEQAFAKLYELLGHSGIEVEAPKE
ncbi:flagellum-specific ATP synthase [Pseudooceanicola batsensis HTCC2597]|uniref:Flagellum-specific ATP synthase n=1 Tax=Pseudooceanicola batsensis (strain ATCC BAA-863 / DSM 15984 / KCTC 12145 / HTCC2597) TaxID=252305 RepID=A3U125_PSEBH|nr:flagellar protein export ATPase FliI [Pseudooceanicola batsensis]EAQ02008.1 flagellum-specific ATP synthase [Pseudooceanicola batsensis HTCC2597]